MTTTHDPYRTHISVSTRLYQACHGHTPCGTGLWGFTLDGALEPVFLRGPYSQVLRQAKRQARHSVRVLP